MFGATEYSTSIDIWYAGCVLAELLLRQPLFPWESAVDQLVEIIKGATFAEIIEMNDIFEGSIIRLARRLDEFLNQEKLIWRASLQPSVTAYGEVSISYDDGRPVDGKGIGRKVIDKLHQTYDTLLEHKDFAYEVKRTYLLLVHFLLTNMSSQLSWKISLPTGLPGMEVLEVTEVQARAT